MFDKLTILDMSPVAEVLMLKLIKQKKINVIINVGTVVSVIYFICVYRSLPAIAGARLVVSLSGDILSPKYAPEITAPAVIAADIPNALPTATRAIPTVADVVYELPVVSETIVETINVRGKKIDGLIRFNP